MEHSNRIDDEQLLDLLDGRLSGQAREDVMAALRADSEEAVRIVELMANDIALRRLGERMLERDVPQRLGAMLDAARGDLDTIAQQRRPARQASARGPLRKLARPLAASMIFLLGLGLGWYGYDRMVPRLTDNDIAYSDAMTAFSFYIDEPGAPLQFSHEQLDDFLPRVREALGRDLSPPDLAAQGFEFFTARLLPGTGGQAVMYLYQNISDPADRIGIYVWRMRTDGRPAGPLPRDQGQFVSRSWNDDDLGYTLLSTPGDRDFDLLEGDIRNHFMPVLTDG